MLHLVRNYSPFTVLILFIYCFVLYIPALSHPIHPESGGLLYQYILSAFNVLFNNNAFIYTFLSLVMVFLQGLYLSAIAVRHRLFLISNYVPVFAYVTFAALLPHPGLFSPPLLAVWPVLAAVDIILYYPQPQHPRTHIFNSGFLLAVAALIHFPAVGLLALFIAALLLFRPLNAGEWIVGLLGYLTPIYFFGGILFLVDKLQLLRRWPTLGISLPTQIKHPLYLTGAAVGIIVLLWAGLYTLQGYLGRMAISVRRGWGAIVIASIVCLIMAILTPSHEASAWLLPLPIMALIGSQPIATDKTSGFSTFIFLFFVALAIFGLVTKPH